MKPEFSFDYNEKNYALSAADNATYELESGITVSVQSKAIEQYDATEWVLWFENTSDRNSGLSAPLCRYLEAGNYDIPFIAFDTYEDIKSYMKKGIVSASIAQNVGKQMEDAFEMLVKHIITGEACPQTIYTDVHLVLKSNMHQFN